MAKTRPGEDGEEEEENFVEEEESDGTEVVPAPVGASQGTGGPTLPQSNQSVSHQSEPSLLAIMQQMTHIMANIKADSSSEASKLPAFNTPSMKAPECSDGTQPFKVTIPNEVRKAEEELHSLRMKEGGHFSFYIADFRKARADHKDYYDPLKSLSNDFSSSKSCAALVGDSRTPLFSSSFNIPSSNSHQSLLSSRDEVFKEIHDVGEDNSVCSLHLFLGNIDLPPSSYHDSLEELWDEEAEPEEIETMMNVVPPAYHQYLDVFSKVKE
ncbi:hypothetical protein O181_102248 [Austropuccinia psidii MF-1]|uniref:Uncharacterized protein n=1 Tax=Austropuccinia psidii MF-1 TaxID=1389203 RepID=A0A9Q3PHX4_9BASI|nr:hypothetical protein [Austropuccinia psidii MF-1]